MNKRQWKKHDKEISLKYASSIKRLVRYGIVPKRWRVWCKVAFKNK